ncbi:MAG: aminomethyltransferase family protein [Planctomycetaceae bacterium]|nr:aminomethyltransferase family protein [Planctomycetaceae bacterium]
MTSPETGCLAASQSVAAFELAPRTTIELRGSDRAAFLHNFCTNDIRKLAPGAGCEAFLTNIKGRILGHIVLSADVDVLWLDSESGTGDFILAHLDRYLITEDVQMIDRSADLVSLLLVGPQAETVLTQHVRDFITPTLWGQVHASMGGIQVMIRRVGFTTPPGYQILVPVAEADRVRSQFTSSGVSLADSAVLEVLRIESGFPRYGVDLTDENIAQEAGRTPQAISFTKGCYLGQEPIARFDALGHTNRELRRVDIEGGPAPAAGTPVLDSSGATVGRITSAALHPLTEKPIALAMLKAFVLTPGTPLTVGDLSATVAAR